MSRPDIERALLEEVSRTREAYDIARKEFLLITSEIPSGLPSPDGVSRISTAGRRSTATMEAYSRALQDLNDFLLRGVIPKRLTTATE